MKKKKLKEWIYYSPEKDQIMVYRGRFKFVYTSEFLPVILEKMSWIQTNKLKRYRFSRIGLL